MNLIDERSLYRTVINAANRLFEGGSFTSVEQSHLADWILTHQNRHQGFIFYPTPEDQQDGLRLFSGEKPKTRLLANNALELETLRLLALIQPESPGVREVCQEANERLLPLCFAQMCTQGECAHASIAFLRYLTAYEPQQALEKVEHAKEVLKQDRDGKGGWRVFPTWFTLLWLGELPLDLVHDELSYAHDFCIQLFRKRWVATEQFAMVRKKILQKVLVKFQKNAIYEKAEFHVDQKGYWQLHLPNTDN